MDLSREIISAESGYLKELESFFNETFIRTNLHSHGLGHHRRVWLYSKELLGYPESSALNEDISIPAKLLIASYLHDSGMSVDPGPGHGYHSRVLCERFLEKHPLPGTDISDLLKAVEDHDNKEYLPGRNDSQLLTILSVADDLDAFGYTGIYRYLEIYLARHIPFERLGYLIQENAANRHRNFTEIMKHVTSLVLKHTIRYEVLRDFFIKYNEQLPLYAFSSGNPSGYCGVAEIIGTIVSGDKTMEEIICLADNKIGDKTVSWYFMKLADELTV